MATYYWVLGTGTWDLATTTNWSASSGGVGAAGVPTSSDAVIFDANSFLAGGTCTVNANVVAASVTCGAMTNSGVLDFSANNNSPTFGTFNCSGTGTRTLNMGSGTHYITGNNGTIWTIATTTNLTLNYGTSTLNFSYSGSTGTRTVISGGTSAHSPYNVFVSAGSDIFSFGTNAPVLNGSLDFTGFTGSWSDTTLTPSITGYLTLGTGMTVVQGSGTITFIATSGTNTITTNGVVVNHPITFNGVGGTWVLGSNLTLATSGSTDNTITLTNGTFNDKGYTVTCGKFSSSNSNTRALTMSGTWTLTGTGTVWNCATSTGMTLTATGSIIKITDTTSSDTFAGGGLTYAELYFNGTTNANTFTISGSNTFTTIKDDGTSAHTLALTTGTTQTVSGFLVSGTSGKLITLQSTTTTPANLAYTGSGVISCDYLNIAYVNVTPTTTTWYAGANSNNTGGADTGWIFTILPNLYWVGGAGNWDNATTTNWSGSSGGIGGQGVPTSAVNVFFDTNSGLSTHTVTATTASCNNLTATTGVSWTLDASGGTIECYGALSLESTITFVDLSEVDMVGASGSININTAGVNIPVFTIVSGPTYTLTSNLVATSSNLGGVTDSFTNSGTLNANGYNITVTNFNNAGTLTMGAGTVTIQGNNTTGGSGYSFYNNGTITANTSLIKFTDTTSSAVTFAGGGFTYNNIYFHRGSSTGTINTTGSNTFNYFQDDGTGTHSIIFTAGTTTTMRYWMVSGTPSHLITLNSTTTATFTLALLDPLVVSSDYLNIQHSVATNGDWYAGIHSVNNQGVATAGSGWVFTAPLGLGNIQSSIIIAMAIV